MAVPTQPFPLSRKLPPTLASIQQYWKTLIRSENLMPFSDDVNLSRLPELSANLMLIDVFAGPQRFRFNYLGESIVRMLDSDITEKFADELEVRSPFNYFVAQASTTVEAQAPTLYSSSSAIGGKTRGRSYLRIMFPTWGNGRVDLLLGAIV